MPRVSKKTIIIDNERPTRSGTPAFFAILVVLGIVVIGGAVMLGRSDGGEIDVSATINQANQVNRDNNTGIEQVETANATFQSMENGGLVPQENQTNAQPVPEVVEVATSTGTSTESVATSSSPMNATTTNETQESVVSTQDSETISNGQSGE